MPVSYLKDAAKLLLMCKDPRLELFGVIAKASLGRNCFLWIIIDTCDNTRMSLML